MVRIFRQAGFVAEVHNVERWSDIPIARKTLAPPFRDMPLEELTVKGFDVVLRHA
jgi:hypothetical protein